MKNILYWCFDLFIIVCFMLFGMVIADSHDYEMFGMVIAASHDYEIWHGALSGLIVHRLLLIILRNIRNHVF